MLLASMSLLITAKTINLKLQVARKSELTMGPQNLRHDSCQKNCQWRMSLQPELVENG